MNRKNLKIEIKYLISQLICKIYQVGNKNQYPKAVMIASDNLPWNYAGTVFLGTGKSPLANKTIDTFLSLSAQI